MINQFSTVILIIFIHHQISPHYFLLYSCTITPKITPPEMKEHLTVLFEDAQIEDNVHDIEIKVRYIS